MQPFHSVKTVIIDDEMSAIMLLEEMVNKLEGVFVNGFAQDVDEGVNQVLRHRPDIIFLDIKLKDENGFDLIQRLKDYDIDPFIVMVTGYDQFGMQALKAGAFDYLLKPLDPNELLKVISRYREKKIHQVMPDPMKKIRFNTLGGFILINPEEILYCKAEANYTDIFLTSQHKHTISMNIGSLEKILAQPQFFRISRSNIINVKFLTGINRGKRHCILTAGQVSVILAISHDRIRELEGELVQ
jgi:two-component system, LytTR family, response regulator